jgi:hypothetical protein
MLRQQFERRSKLTLGQTVTAEASDNANRQAERSGGFAGED